MSCQRDCSISCLSMLLHIPCFDLCISCCLLFKMKNPFDAEKLTDMEAKSYIDRLQGNLFTIQNMSTLIFLISLGLWTLTPVSQSITSHCFDTELFKSVFVHGNQMTFSGGNGLKTLDTTFQLYLTSDGILFLDDIGTECVEFAPEKGIIQIRNALGTEMLWKRDDVAIVNHQPTSNLDHENEFTPANTPGLPYIM